MLRHLARGLEGSEQSGSLPVSHTIVVPTQRQHFGTPEEELLVVVPQIIIFVLTGIHCTAPGQFTVLFSSQHPGGPDGKQRIHSPVLQAGN